MPELTFQQYLHLPAPIYKTFSSLKVFIFLLHTHLQSFNGFQPQTSETQIANKCRRIIIIQNVCSSFSKKEKQSNRPQQPTGSDFFPYILLVSSVCSGLLRNTRRQICLEPESVCYYILHIKYWICNIGRCAKFSICKCNWFVRHGKWEKYEFNLKFFILFVATERERICHIMKSLNIQQAFRNLLIQP